MYGLSFDNLPHYIYSNNRQFLENEHHMERVFDEDVLLLVRKGTLRFSENGVPIEVRAGEYYLQRAGLRQTGPVPSDIPNYFFIHFHGTFCENGKLPLRGTFDEASIMPIVDAIRLLGNIASPLEYERHFYALLSELCKQQHNETLAESILVYLVRHYKENLALTDLCAKFFLTKNQIISVFHSAYGRTPHRYLMDYRLEKAAELLVTTNRPIGGIAYEVGFQEYSVFYRAFLSKYEISPADFRKIKIAKFFMPPARERPKKREE